MAGRVIFLRPVTITAAQGLTLALGDDAFASPATVGSSLEDNVGDLNGEDISSVFALVGQIMNGA